MASTWTEVNRKLDFFLGDAKREGSRRLFALPLRIEAWNWAQRQLCYHTPRAMKMTAVIESGNRELVLPTDFFAAERIYDSEEEQWWWPMRLRHGDVRYTDDDVLEFWTHGDRLYLETEKEYDSKDLVLYYWSYWPEISYTETLEDDGDWSVDLESEIIYTPQWAELALCHLATATCMMPGEIFAADINQYKIRLESGTPIHNPRGESAKFHLWWWNVLLDKFRPVRRFEAVQ